MDSSDRVSRRGFLKSAGMAAVGGGILGDDASPAPERQDVQVEVREYRTLGRTGFRVSDIGFGAGYLNNANVLQVALDRGINYIDTAEHYANGQSERAVGEALKGRDRSAIFLTTKLNLSLGASTHDGLRQRFHRCLERLQTDYVDCFMIHMTPRVEEVTHETFHAVAQELKAEGKVRFLGLSNHGTEYSLAGRVEHRMQDIVGAAAEDGRFDVALFVYNFLQQDQGEQVIRACKAKNMGVTLMKTDPVNFHAGIVDYLNRIRERGREVPETIQRLADEYEAFVQRADEFKQRHGLESTAQIREAAIKFALGNPDVHTVCPSMNTFEELETFVRLSGQRLSSEDDSMLGSYAGLLGRYYCRHACGLCESACPRGVAVNTVMRYNHYFESHGREKVAMLQYAALKAANAAGCEDCPGHCGSACPYGVPVRTLLAGAHRNLTLV